MNNKWLYKVGGKPSDLIIPLIATVIFAVITILMHGFFILVIFTIGMAALSLYSAYGVMFVKLLIGENSFCHCKSPWDKKEYAYNDISEAWESEGVVNNGANVCYFNYRIPSGEVKRFRFLPYQYEEIVFLLKKINGDDYFDNCEENYDE